MTDIHAAMTSLDDLDDRLSEPTAAAIESLARFRGDILVLGVGGKMGPTLARMAVRASQAAGIARRVIGVARFSEPGLQQRLESWGVKTVAADLLDRTAWEQLPDAPLVVYLAGRKFGSTGQEWLTWAMNTYVPALACERYRGSRIVALSTGNVYGLVPVSSGGSRETDPLRPVGEYAQSCLGRERIFQHFSDRDDTPVALIRLNYACELRYGVLVDLAQKVWSGQPIDRSMSAFNVLWQGDANAMVLAAFDQAASPATVLNVTGPETLRVEEIGREFGRLLDRDVKFTGEPQTDALLNNAAAALARYGSPRVSVPTMMTWIANWLQRGGMTLNKPTHFESRDGNF